MEILETLLDIGIDMLDGFALLYLCRSMLKECRIKRAAVYYLFVLPIAAVIFAFNHYFPTVGGMVVTLLFMLATVLALFRDKMRYRILWFCVAQVLPFAIDITVSKAILEACLHRSADDTGRVAGFLPVCAHDTLYHSGGRCVHRPPQAVRHADGKRLA